MFFLGTHQPQWLARTDVPLFVSRRRLAGLRRLPRALGKWALDSGAFSELSLFGGWTITYQRYVDEVRRFKEEIGGLLWAAPMDWMCEPWILEKTKATITEHQMLTAYSVLDLRTKAPDVLWIPVLQGWKADEYETHIKMYLTLGIDLQREPVVGIGSVCRRQGTEEAAEIIRRVHAAGVRIHAFGFKIKGLRRVARQLVSADSMAWSFAARRKRVPMFVECRERHKNCANCLRYALAWREDVMRAI